MSHICISKLVHTIDSGDTNLLPVWCQAITWTSALFCQLDPLGQTWREIVIPNTDILFQGNAFKCVMCDILSIYPEADAFELIKEIDLFVFRDNFTEDTFLTHWGRVTHICVGNLTIIGSDNGLSPGRLQAIIWTNAGILLIGPLGTNFSEILFGIHTFSSRKMHMKMSSVKCRPFCLGLNVLRG